MNNYKQPGDALTLTAPAGGVTSGLGYKIGQLFVAAKGDAAVGEPFVGQVSGVIELVKDAGTAWSEGELLYWDDTAENVTPTSTGNLLIGVAAVDAESADVLGDVLLNPGTRGDGPIDIAAGSNIIKGEDLGEPNVLDDDYFLNSVVMQATAYTLDETTLPADNPPRNVIITHTTDTTTDTLGDAVVVGTDVNDEAISETITVGADAVATGAKAFKTIVSVTTAGWVIGGGVADLIEVGFGHLLGLSEVRAAATEVFLAALAGVTRLPDAVAIHASNVEENTIALNGGTYDGSKTAKALIKL